MVSEPRKIHCADCGLYLGEIRDATLRKGITYRCERCSSPQIESVPDFLRDIVNGRRK